MNRHRDSYMVFDCEAVPYVQGQYYAILANVLVRYFFRDHVLLPCKLSQEFLSLLLLFLYFAVSCFLRNSRLCQLLTLCFKCCCPETWTGFQTFFECQHYKKKYLTSLHESCVQITDLLWHDIHTQVATKKTSTGPLWKGGF